MSCNAAVERQGRWVPCGRPQSDAGAVPLCSWHAGDMVWGMKQHRKDNSLLKQPPRG